MSTPFHCEVPIHLDPGVNSDDVERYYLVTGVPYASAGAYASWPSANALHKQYKDSSLKAYALEKWNVLQGAWHAACERGEHPHPANHATTPAPPATPARRRTAHTASPVKSPSTSRAQAPPSTSRTQPPSSASRTRSTGHVPPVRVASPAPVAQSSSRAVVAVRRVNGVGQIYDDPAVAQREYERLRREGGAPVMFISQSLVEAMRFVDSDLDGLSDGGAPSESSLSSSD